jgi:predicted NAD/FAD-dependent oxidoreductase
MGASMTLEAQTALVVATVGSGGVFVALIRLFAGKRKRECREDFGALYNKNRDCEKSISVMKAQSDEHRLNLERRLTAIEGKINTIDEKQDKFYELLLEVAAKAKA